MKRRPLFSCLHSAPQDVSGFSCQSTYSHLHDSSYVPEPDTQRYRAQRHVGTGSGGILGAAHANQTLEPEDARLDSRMDCCIRSWKSCKANSHCSAWLQNPNGHPTTTPMHSLTASLSRAGLCIQEKTSSPLEMQFPGEGRISPPLQKHTFPFAGLARGKPKKNTHSFPP